LGPFFHGKFQNLKTTEDTFGHDITPLAIETVLMNAVECVVSMCLTSPANRSPRFVPDYSSSVARAPVLQNVTGLSDKLSKRFAFIFKFWYQLEAVYLFKPKNWRLQEVIMS